MRHKPIFVIAIFIIGVLLCKHWPYSMTVELMNIKVSSGQEPKPSFEDDDVSYYYYQPNTFQHRKQLKDLGNIVQRRLHKLQNSVSCRTTRKINCLVHHNCGFGCQINTVALCLMIGYAINRTVTVQPSMTSLIKPLSTTCTSAIGKNSKRWGPLIKDPDRVQVIHFQPISDRYKTEFFPPAIPEDLADKMARFNDNPFLWWAGQISSYVYRPTEATSEFLKKEEARLGFSSPIVGVQIRRTDKLKHEAKYHHVDEYMVLVDKWYDHLELTYPRVSRRLFLATDDPGVKREIHKRYPRYEILNNDNFTQSAKVPSQRKTKSGYLGIIHDIHMLSRCDYLVCTFSSNVCRLAYQLMQSLQGNVTQRAASLDRPWFFWGQSEKFKTTDVVRAKMPLYADPSIP